MNIARKARHLGIVGQSGTGKTTAAIRYILGSHHARIAVADHEGEFAHRLNVPLNLSWETFYDALQVQRICCFDITEISPGFSNETFDLFCQSVLELNKDVFEPKGMETLLVIDEVQKYTTSHKVPEHFKACLETGRKWNLDTLSLSQRPNGIHGDIREQFTEVFIFRMNDPLSHEFGEYFGIAGADQSALKDGEFIHLNRKTGTRRAGSLWTGAKIIA